MAASSSRQPETVTLRSRWNFERIGASGAEYNFRTAGPRLFILFQGNSIY